MTFRVFFAGVLALFCSLKARTEPPYRIAFNSFAPRNQAIFLADADGANAKELAPNAAINWNPSFSPDGQWVVFTSNRGAPPITFVFAWTDRGWSA